MRTTTASPFYTAQDMLYYIKASQVQMERYC